MTQKELDNLTVLTHWESPNRDRYGEYFGVPMNKWSAFGHGHLTPQIVIFAQPIIEHCREDVAIIRKVRKVLLHEIGHAFLGTGFGVHEADPNNVMHNVIDNWLSNLELNPPVAPLFNSSQRSIIRKKLGYP